VGRAANARKRADPYVRITVNQRGRVQSKQTRVLRSTRSAVFKEAVMFLVSVRPEDLDQADVEVAVLDAARVDPAAASVSAGAISLQQQQPRAADDAVGYVFLGLRAQDRLERDQWRQTVQAPGREARAIHQLRPFVAPPPARAQNGSSSTLGSAS